MQPASASGSAMTVAFHLRLSAAFLIKKHLRILHYLDIWHSKAQAIQGFLYFSAKLSGASMRISC